MNERPTFDYGRPPPPARLRAADYVIATVGAAFTFAGAFVLLAVFAGTMFDAWRGPVNYLLVVGVPVLALAAAASSFFGTLKRCRRKRAGPPGNP